MRPRARGILVAEAVQLEALSHATPDSSPDRPTLLRRLAEAYVELEHASSGPATAAARRHAIDRYLELRTNYPTYPRMDEALYYLALEYERAEDAPDARKTYLALLQEHPDSKLVPLAYLAFGELFFVEASTDPSKWPLAREAYAKSITYPPPGNTAYGYAWFRLAQVHSSLGDTEHAREALQKTIDYGAAHPEAPNASNLSALAREALARLGPS
jgi:tetratricopeptide (TPR) repeat protein